MLVLLIPVVVVVMLVRHHWGVLEGRWEFRGKEMMRMVEGGEGEREREGEVNGTLGVSIHMHLTIYASFFILSFI